MYVVNFSYNLRKTNQKTCTLRGAFIGPFMEAHQWRSQDFHQGGAQLERKAVIVSGEATHGQLGWP